MSELKARLHKYIKKIDSGCWLYQKSMESNGYTRVMVNRKRYGSHRLSWLIYRGTIPAGLFVCHKCDIPSCVNPDHLFLGTQKENLIDCTKKNRLYSAKLTTSDIPKIREMLREGLSLRKIAKVFHVHHKTIMCVKNKSQWSYA